MSKKDFYRETNGSLQYLASVSRPHIAFQVNKASKSVQSSTAKDWNNLKRIFRYLNGAKSLGISQRKIDENTILKPPKSETFLSSKRSSHNMVSQKFLKKLCAVWTGGRAVRLYFLVFKPGIKVDYF